MAAVPAGLRANRESPHSRFTAANDPGRGIVGGLIPLVIVHQWIGSGTIALGVVARERPRNY
jgi:hypothetical protein